MELESQSDCMFVDLCAYMSDLQYNFINQYVCQNKLHIGLFLIIDCFIVFCGIFVIVKFVL